MLYSVKAADNLEILTNIATISYTATAVAYLFLSILLLTSWRGRLYGMMLTVACLFSALWAIVLASHSSWGYPSTSVIGVLELIRNMGWTVFLITLLGPFQESSDDSPPKIRSFVLGISLLYLISLFFILYSQDAISLQPYGKVGSIGYIVSCIVMAIIGVMLVEQFYRNTPAEKRWGIKFIGLGIGAIFIYDFYLYSDALLFRYVNEDIWAARGVINAFVVPLIAISAARNPRWSVGISVSRHIVFYSAALFGTAVYLLVMAAAGYYLRYSGGSWGTVLQVMFLFGAIILLLGILFSGTIRSWLKVFISKHFYSYNYDYREEWLRFTRILSEKEHDLNLRERIIQALAQLVESSGGQLWMASGTQEYVPVAFLNVPKSEEKVLQDCPFCQFMKDKEWTIDLEEYEYSPDKYNQINLPPWLQACTDFRFIVPLMMHKNLLGFVLLSKPRSYIKLNWEINDLLKVAGSQAASYLAQDEATHALSVARQFESFNRMSTFVVHDIKNLIAQLSLLLSNAERHKDNPEFQSDMLQTVNLSVHKMRRLLEKLSGGNQAENPSIFLLEQLVQDVVESKSMFEPKPEIDVLDDNLYISANKSRFERVLGHLVQNAIEATPRDGWVRVILKRQDNHAIIEISDNGSGMSVAFVSERLFKPFESTKSAGMGIGVFESREYVQELGGQIEVESVESKGTVFRLRLELLENDYAKNRLSVLVN